MKTESQPQSSMWVEFGPFSFDKALEKLSKQGTPIRLRGMPLKILRHMVDHPGEVVSRAELQSLLWDGTAFGDFEQGLNTAMNVVRKTLGDSAENARYIETIPGQGYRFIAPVRLAVSSWEVDKSSQQFETASKKAVPSRFRNWGIAAGFAIAVIGAGSWWTFQSRPKVLGVQILGDSVSPSANKEANDQYEMAMNFLAVQNDIPRARKTFERALELDPHFSYARLQIAGAIIIEIYNGYTNDGNALLQAEEELHQAEQVLPGPDGLILSTQAAVYLAEGRLDRIPMAKLEEYCRKGGNPTWLVILKMLEGKTGEALAFLRARIEKNPLENPSRMLLGELLRTQSDTAGAIKALKRVLEQAPGNVTAAWFLTMAYLDEGKPQQARTLLEGMRPGFDKNYMWRHAWAILLAAEGKRDDARQAMDEGTLKFARLTWVVTSETADFYALQGDRTKAIEWLQLAISRGDERVPYFRRNPRLAALRDDTRFQSLLKSVEARRK